MIVGVLLAGLSGAVAQAGPIDVVQAPTLYFVPTDGQKYDDGYWRWYNEDWGWTHGGVDAPTLSATLLLSAFDVDLDSGDIDNVYAWLNGTKTLLGHLDGNDDVWAFTSFNLDINIWSADLVAGLKVWIDIDSTHSSDMGRNAGQVGGDHRWRHAASPKPGWRSGRRGDSDSAGRCAGWTWRPAAEVPLVGVFLRT